MRSFGSVVTSLREEKGINQEEFAAELSKLCGKKISRSAVSMWETNQRRPKYEIIEAIADWYNVDIEYVLGKTDNRFRIKNPAAYDGDGKAHISEKDIMLLEWFRSLPQEKQEAILTAQDAPKGLV